MTALIVLGIIALLFAFLLSLKATVTVAYCGEVELYVRVLFLKFKILPQKRKKYPRSMSAKKAQRIKARRQKKAAEKLAKKNAKKQSKDRKGTSRKSEEDQDEKKSTGEILDIISLVAELISAVIGKFFGHLRIKIARIRLVIATGDAASTAILYGAVTQSINVLFPLIDQIKTVRTPVNKDIDVRADFCAEESEIDIEISFALRVWHLFHVAFAALGKFIKYIFKTVRRKSEKQSDGSFGNNGHKVR